jgi:hypothetical protein
VDLRETLTLVDVIPPAYWTLVEWRRLPSRSAPAS